VRIIVAGKGYNGTDIEELLFANARIEGENAALRAECERLIRQTTADAEMLAYRKNEVAAAVRIIQGKDARIAELEAALTEIHELLSNYRHGKAKARAAAALKGDAE